MEQMNDKYRGEGKGQNRGEAEGQGKGQSLEQGDAQMSGQNSERLGGLEGREGGRLKVEGREGAESCAHKKREHRRIDEPAGCWGDVRFATPGEFNRLLASVKQIQRGYRELVEATRVINKNRLEVCDDAEKNKCFGEMAVDWCAMGSEDGYRYVGQKINDCLTDILDLVEQGYRVTICKSLES